MSEGNGRYDVAVVGGGPGGYVAALRAAQLGLKTALIERERLGGVCLNWGCIPTKALLESARLLDGMRRAADFGLLCRDPAPDWSRMVKRSRDAASRMSKGVESLVKKSRIDLFQGSASLEGPSCVRVVCGDGDKVVEAANIILAVGAAPNALPGFDLDGERIIGHREALVLPEIPPRILIIGAGAIGVEFAYLFSAMGSEVTLVEVLEQVLPLEDEDVSRLVQRAFEKRGIRMHTSSKVTAVQRDRDVWRYTIAAERKSFEVDADLCLVAVGVHADLDGLGTERIGLQLERGFIKVNSYMRTGVPGVWAVGDCAGAPLLAHAASQEGICAVESIANVVNPGIAHDNIPACVYCQPQVASVGLTEKQAREAGHKIRVGNSFFVANGFAQAAGETAGFVKFIVGSRYHEVLGVHIVGPGAPDLIAEVVLGRVMELSAREFLTTIHAHPTLSEAVRDAAGAALGEAIHV